MQLIERQRMHWRKNLKVTGMLLAIWFFATFVVSYFARDLSFNFFGWPFSFWVASQGAPLVYLVLVCIYARLMRRLDEAHGTTEEGD